MIEIRNLDFIHVYFSAEKQASGLFFLIGLLSIVLSMIFFFFIKTSPAFYKGAAVPLLLIGLLQSMVGFTVYARTDKQEANTIYKIEMNPQVFIQQKEMPRMQKLMENFKLYQGMEIILIITSIALILRFKSKPARGFWFGFGIALLLQSVLLWGADYRAAKRATVYMDKLQQEGSR